MIFCIVSYTLCVHLSFTYKVACFILKHNNNYIVTNVSLLLVDDAQNYEHVKDEKLLQ